MSSATPDIPDVPPVLPPVKKNTFQLMRDTWRGFSKKQKFNLVAVFALVLGLPMILGGVYTAKYIGSRAETPITPPVTPPTCRDYYGGTYGPSCGAASSYYHNFYCPDGTAGVVGDTNLKTCYKMDDLVNMAEEFCSNNHCSTPAPTPAITPSPTPNISTCNQSCNYSVNPQITCSSNLTCYNSTTPPGTTGASGVCRNPSCIGSPNCICPTPVPTPTRTPTPTPRPTVTPIPVTPRPTPTPSKLGCGAVCQSSTACSTGLICYQPPTPTCPPGKICPMIIQATTCRNISCVNSTNCICATPTPTVIPTPTPAPICRFRIFGFCLIWSR